MRMRRQPRNREGDLPCAGNFSGDVLQECRREPKRQAAVADAVLMAAFETMMVIAEKERARRKRR